MVDANSNAGMAALGQLIMSLMVQWEGVGEGVEWKKVRGRGVGGG